MRAHPIDISLHTSVLFTRGFKPYAEGTLRVWSVATRYILFEMVTALESACKDGILGQPHAQLRTL